MIIGSRYLAEFWAMNNKGILDHHQQLVISDCNRTHCKPTVNKYVVKYYAKKKARVGTIAYALVPIAFFCSVLFTPLFVYFLNLSHYYIIRHRNIQPPVRQMHHRHAHQRQAIILRR